MRGKANWGKTHSKKKRGWPLYKPITNRKSFKLQTQVSSSLTQYPIKQVLVLYMFSDESNKLETYTYVRKKIQKIQISS